MSKAVDEILNSIIEEFKAGRQAKEELEAKSLFRLLNYCPPPAATDDLRAQTGPRAWSAVRTTRYGTRGRRRGSRPWL